MAVEFNQKTWYNEESGGTPIIAEELNRIEKGISQLTERVNAIREIAFSGSYNDLSDKPSIPTVTNNDLATEAGTAWDAVRGAAIRAEVDAIKTELDNKIGYGTDADKLISDITDFNDAREFGSYRSTLIAQILSIANRPPDITVGGHVRLDVMALSIGTSYTLQRLHYTDLDHKLRIYERVYLTSWGDWERIAMHDDLPQVPPRLAYSTAQTPSSTAYTQLKLNTSTYSDDIFSVAADGTDFTLQPGIYLLHAVAILKNVGTATNTYFLAFDRGGVNNRFAGTQIMLDSGQLQSVNVFASMALTTASKIGLEVNGAPQVGQVITHIVKLK